MEISKNLGENLDYIKQALFYPLSEDVVLREFTIQAQADIGALKAFLVYYDGTTQSGKIDQFVVESLHLTPHRVHAGNLEDLIYHQLISRSQLSRQKEMDKVLELVNYGGCAVFVDTVGTAFVADVKGWEVRGVERPSSEGVVRGPQNAFGEVLRTNTATLRKMIRDPKLICEGQNIGNRSHTQCNILYMQDIANEKLVAEVRRRLQQIDVDFVFDSGEVEQLIEQFSYDVTPQMLSTERPDRVAAALADGKVAVLVDGSPYALIMPISIFELAHTTEDNYLRIPFANLLRIIRLLAMSASVLLPGLYIAIIMYHHEAIPIQLLFAIEASREKVPFPMLIELILLEIAFEFIREASVRAPSQIAQTIGIIGGLIIGSAVVEAHLVSPIIIILVALTGIGSLATPNYYLSFSFRVMKFWYILMAAVGGLLGFSFAMFLQLILLCNAQSFGVPFMAPLAPKMPADAVGTLFVHPIWKRETRQQMLNPQQPSKQAHISRRWAMGKNSDSFQPAEEVEVDRGEDQ